MKFEDTEKNYSSMHHLWLFWLSHKSGYFIDCIYKMMDDAAF